MKMIVSSIALLIASPIASQTATNPGLPDRGAFAETREEQAAGEVVMSWDRLKAEGKALDATRLYISPNFKEHLTKARLSTNGKSDYDNMIEMAERMAAMPPRGPRPQPPGFPKVPSQVRVSEDMVTLFHTYGADIFRVQNGKITDHWDASPWKPFNAAGEDALLAATRPRPGGPVESRPSPAPLPGAR